MIRLFVLAIKILVLLSIDWNMTVLAIEWFENNHMKINQEKCHLLVSGHKHENIWARIGETKIWECRKQKLLCRN